MKPVKKRQSIPKIPKIQKLQAQVNNLEMQISEYQQIVKELSDKLELLNFSYYK
jgi:predicted RNase H-like nuclease (RuvC/YqgF family)